MVPSPAARPIASRGLKRGDLPQLGVRKPPVAGLGLQYGATIGEITHCVLTGMKRGTIDDAMGRLILNKILPAARPVQLDMPRSRARPTSERPRLGLSQALNSGADLAGRGAAAAAMGQERIPEQ